MGDIKRNINSITDLKRDSVNVNFVYRGATLVWQRITSTKLWLTSGLSTILSSSTAQSDVWSTNGFNKKFR
jgi:hypothetical protein